MDTIKHVMGLSLPHLLILVLLLILILCLLIFLLFRAAHKKSDAGADKPPQKAEPPQEKPSRTAGVVDVRGAMDHGVTFLKSITSKPSYRYDLPWILMMGSSGSGKTTLLKNSGLTAPFPKGAGEASKIASGCRVRPYKNGVVVDVAGDLVLNKEGSGSDDKAWSHLLQQLQKHRPQRPIDGIVLTIDCNDLLDDTPETAAAKADQLYKKLWHAQKVLELRLPVYVVVTKCDRVTGFKNFCLEIPDTFSQNMFGWSSPYSGETAYSSEWVNEAFTSVGQTLYRLEYELFTKGAATDNQDNLFLFASNFTRLADPLKIYLDGLFKQSIYHELFIMRGLYFCGDSGLDHSPEPVPTPFFVNDLFEKKVFPESPLARPLEAVRVSRNRKIRIMQVAAVLLVLLGTAALYYAGRVLVVEKKPLIDVLGEIQADLEYLQAKRSEPRETIRIAQFPKSTYDLLNGMAKIHTSELRSFLIPASRYGKLNQDIIDCMSRAYREIIMVTIRTDLENRTKDYIDNPDRPLAQDDLALLLQEQSSRKEAPTTSLAETQEFLDLHQYVRNMAELEIHIDLFNKLARAGEKDLVTLARIIKYLYGLDLPENFYTQAGYYQETLARITMKPIFYEPYRQPAEDKAKRLMYEFYQIAFLKNPLVLSLKQLASQLDSLGSIRGCQTDGCMIWGLLENIQRIEKGLNATDLTRIMKNPPELWAPVQAILDTMKKSKFFGPPIAERAEKIAQSHLIELRNEWLKVAKQYTGTLIQTGGSGKRVMLSSYVESIKLGLIDLWQQDFTGSDLIAAPPIIIPPSARFRWNVNLLNEASALVVEYDKYRSGGFTMFPPNLRPAMDQVARDCLEKTVLQFVARASSTMSAQYGYESHVTEANALDEAGNFQSAAKSLSFLFDAFDRLHMTTGHHVLTDLVYWQTSSLLGLLNGILENEILYEPDTTDVARWETAPNLALAAFKVTDEKELKYYLSLQRQRVDYLSGYAAPMVNFYNQSHMQQAAKDGSLFFKWGQIDNDLKDYQINKPDNPVTTLESFIIFQVMNTTLQNFYQMISRADLQAHSSDYFLEKRNDIRRALYRQCRHISADKLQDKYENIRNFFNNCLSGRFPFAGGSVDIGVGSSPENIRQFYRLYDLYAEDIRNVLSPEEKNAAVDFLDRMGQVRPVFDSFLDPPPEEKKPAAQGEEKATTAPPGDGGQKEAKPDAPVLNFDLEFRVNRPREENANKIMEWTMEVGPYEYVNDGSIKNGIWEYNDPVVLNLRFAKDSGYRPDPSSATDNIIISGKTITYRFPDPWALLTMITHYPSDPRDFVKHVDPNPYTLKFCINTISEETASGEEAQIATKAFIRLTPMTAAKAPITLPCFPVIAPPWN